MIDMMTIPLHVARRNHPPIPSLTSSISFDAFPTQGVLGLPFSHSNKSNKNLLHDIGWKSRDPQLFRVRFAKPKIPRASKSPNFNQPEVGVFILRMPSSTYGLTPKPCWYGVPWSLKNWKRMEKIASSKKELCVVCYKEELNKWWWYSLFLFQDNNCLLLPF